MLMNIDEYLNSWVEDAKSLNIAKKGDIAVAIGVSSSQLSNLLSGRDYWRATYIDGLCTVTKQRFTWPRNAQTAENERLYRMVMGIMAEGGNRSITTKTIIEQCYKEMISEKEKNNRADSPAIKKAAGI